MRHIGNSARCLRHRFASWGKSCVIRKGRRLVVRTLPCCRLDAIRHRNRHPFSEAWLRIWIAGRNSLSPHRRSGKFRDHRQPAGALRWPVAGWDCPRWTATSWRSTSVRCLNSSGCCFGRNHEHWMWQWKQHPGRWRESNRWECRKYVNWYWVFPETKPPCPRLGNQDHPDPGPRDQLWEGSSAPKCLRPGRWKPLPETPSRSRWEPGSSRWLPHAWPPAWYGWDERRWCPRRYKNLSNQLP